MTTSSTTTEIAAGASPSVAPGRDRPRGRYGLDAPYVPALLAGVGIAAIALGVTGIWSPAWTAYVYGAVMIQMAGLYLHTTVRGKRAAWEDLLDDLCMRGDEQVLDIGCGRGAVLNAAAARLTSGTAVGVDIWRNRDQSGNGAQVAEANARIEGVAERVVVVTADMTALPFPDESFDLVLSSVAVHNVSGADARATAIREAYRVLRPGGMLVIADLFHTAAYARVLSEIGAIEVTRRSMGVRGMWGPLPTVVVLASRL